MSVDGRARAARSRNPFIHLRLGQCQLELGNPDRAADELARAYMGAGAEKLHCHTGHLGGSMVGIYGPAWPRRFGLTAGLKLSAMPTEPPRMVTAAKLGEALDAYGHEFGARLTLYDGSNPLVPFAPGEEPKFFVHTDKDGLASLVDVHVNRGSEMLCCKQRLDFALQEGDVVDIGELAC